MFSGSVTAQEAVTAAPVPEVVTVDNISTEQTGVGYTRSAPTPGIGQPQPRGWDLQEPMTPIAREAVTMAHLVLNPVIGAICVLVLGLLLWVIFRYRAAANPVPSRTSHNLVIEVLWTLVPALILLFIAFPSFKLLANQYNPPKADLTIKVTGYQWYWGYEYPDYGRISFDALPLSKEEAEKEGVPYLLDTDNRIVVPAGATVKLLVTAADVLHSFAVPSFWVKMDAVPGRINETWFKVDRPGVYYGQCSELCGTKHGFMPIAVEVLPEEEFKAWVRMRQQADGIEPTGPGIAPVTAPATAEAAPAVTPTPAA
ncbi:MAG: cytochrome c oxidase subunit II [Sphingomonadaceae bacterium]